MNTRLKKILVAFALCFTLYNTLPSIFFYTKSLDAHPSKKQAISLVKNWQASLVKQDEELKSWLFSYANTLEVHLLKISSIEKAQKILALEFATPKDAALFERYFQKATSHLPFKNIKLALAAKDESSIYLIKNTFHPSSIDNISYYTAPVENNAFSKDYKKVITSRIASISQLVDKLDPIDLHLENQKHFITKHNPLHEILTLLKPFKNQPACLEKFISFGKDHDSPWTHLVSTSDSQDPFVSTLQYSLQKLDHSCSQTQAQHPLIKSYAFDGDDLSITIQLHEDILSLKDMPAVKNLLVELFSKLSAISQESFIDYEKGYKVFCFKNKNSPLIVSKLDTILAEQAHETATILKTLFKPESADFNQDNFNIVKAEDFSKLSYLDQENALIVSSGYDLMTSKDSAKDSLFIIYKNGDRLVKDLEKGADVAKSSQKDFKQLVSLISCLDFKLVPHADLLPSFKGDLVFELKEATKPLWDCLKEHHKLYPEANFAIAELGTIKDRLHEQNTQQLKEQEALLKWQQQYQASLNNLNGLEKYTIAKPIKSPLISNVILNINHFFTGSAKKALKFGLDLSGGKNVLIQLEDQKGKKITDPEAIKIAINELYARVNRLGVSEVSIRQEGDYISLDFPGSQNLCAKDLINASTMFFHIVNEQYSVQNPQLYPYVNDFLHQVWEQAKQSGNTETKNIQLIAYSLLNEQNSSSIKLKENGLKIAHPDLHFSTDDLNTTYSKIVKIKTESQEAPDSCPLLIVFNNYALEGSALKDITTSYDPSKGNFLSFTIQKNVIDKQREFSPQQTLHAWTMQYTKNKMQQSFKPLHNWRMAVILNGEVVSSPVLESHLKEAASITGSFSQQDLLKLKADLQAGAMTFQPKIIYEQNIAPELGETDKTSGFISMAISLVLVICLMSAYYRFHGMIATCALLLNLVLLFAAASFLNITLSLASIAGIILTLGMAVDANVLIFERMREEKTKGASVKEAVLKGYKRAFSAIFDSNLTTMIAAIVLLGFDSGPIKGFALTLLVGLITSVITALFMTKMFYFHWIEKTKHLSMNFANWFKFENLNFFKYTKTIVIASFIILFAGAFSFINNFNQIIGMDFKGGYAFNLKIEPNASLHDTKEALNSAFIQAGLKPSFVHIRQLETPHHMRVFLDKNIHTIKSEQDTWSAFIGKIAKNAHINLNKDCINTLDSHVSTISGQLSTSMTRQAILGLGMALGAIFIYLLIRFELSYALSATISLCHDVILTIATMGILAYFNVPITLDMSSLAAILTIIGYSLNDTIIVFDRIREEMGEVKQVNIKSLVLKSLNTTLSRTVMTSATTLIVLIPMIFIGQGTLFNFSLVMTLGVVLGTLSTLFIACPLFIFLKIKKNLEIPV